MALMKTTLEIPDFLFRRAKSAAAQRGIPLRQLVTEAVQEKLKMTSQEKPWMKHFGKLLNDNLTQNWEVHLPKSYLS